MKAAGYDRVSRDRDGTKLSPEIQRQRIRKHAEEHDMELVDIIEDIDVPGSSFRRDGWNQLVDKLDDIDAIVVTELSRFGRNMRETINWSDRLDKAGVELIAIDDRIDTTTAIGKAAYHISLTFNQMELDRLSERLTATHAQIAREGRWRGGIPPMGYKYDNPDDCNLVIDEDEAAIVKWIYQLRIGGHSYNSIAKTLQEAGVRGKRGGKIVSQSVKTILHNPMYIGKREYNGELYDLDVPTIIDDETWAVVQALKVTRKNAKPQQYLLSSLMTCSECDGTLHRQKRYGEKRDCWRCEEFCVHIDEVVAEREVIGQFLDHINADEYAAALDRQAEQVKVQTDNVKALRSRLRAAEQKQDLLFDEYSEGNVSQALWERQTRKLDEQIHGLRTTLETMEATLLTDRQVLRDFSAAWDRMDTPARRQALKIAIEKIVIHPGRGDRVKIDWR